jgi:hypothetical protein
MNDTTTPSGLDTSAQSRETFVTKAYAAGSATSNLAPTTVVRFKRRRQIPIRHRHGIAEAITRAQISERFLLPIRIEHVVAGFSPTSTLFRV